jgi:quinolinate synthase
MAMNDLQSLLYCLEHGSGEIHVEPELCVKALLPLQRMVNFSKERALSVKGNA